jgi:hypothetical protein
MADPGKVNIVLVPALLGLVGFFIYYKKNNKKQAGAEKSAKAGKTKPVKAKAVKAKRAKKVDSTNPEPVRPTPQRQLSKAGGRMGSVL